MSKVDELASMLSSMSSGPKTSPYDTVAEVVMVEGDTAWVHIPGGVDETPAKLTMSVSEGDVVQLRVSGGRAWITGNASAPPTDDTEAFKAQDTANSAQKSADIAAEAAEQAVGYSEEARIASEEAKGIAESVRGIAEDAQESADQAKESATAANTAATGALNGLATVEDVVGTLNWIAEHGRYILTEDTEVKPEKIYYNKTTGPTGDNILTYPYLDTTNSPKTVNGVTFTDNGDRTVTVRGTTTHKDGGYFVCHDRWQTESEEFVLPNGDYWIDGNPIAGVDNDNYTTRINVGVTKNGGWQTLVYDYTDGAGVGFTISGDDFSTDQANIAVQLAVRGYGTSVDNVKFSPRIRAIGDIYTRVDNPTGDPSSHGWYELSVDEAVSNYVASHLSLTQEGLFLTMDNTGYKLKLTGDGAYIIDGQNNEVASYSDTAVIGSVLSRNVLIDSNAVSIRSGTNVLSMFGDKAIIGDIYKNRVEIASDSTEFYDADNQKICEFSLGRSQTKTITQVNEVEEYYTETVSKSLSYSISGSEIVARVRMRVLDYTYSPDLREKDIERTVTISDLNSDANVQFLFSETNQPANGFIRYLKNTNSVEVSFTGSKVNHTWGANNVDYIQPHVEQYIEVPNANDIPSGEYINVYINSRNTGNNLETISFERASYQTVIRTSLVVRYEQGSTGSDYIVVRCDYFTRPIITVRTVVARWPYLRNIELEYQTASSGTSYVTFGNRKDNELKGGMSFTSGEGLIASEEHQTAFGKYNDYSSDHAFVIGKGTGNNARSNAFSVGWNGDGAFDGGVSASGFETDVTASQGFRHIVDGNNQTILPIGFYVERLDTGVKGWFGVNASGEFLDLYSATNNYPVIRYDATNDLTTVRNVKSTQTNGAAFTHSVPSGSLAAFRAENSATNKSVELQVGSGGTNRGVYVPGKGWILYYNDEDVFVDGFNVTDKLRTAPQTNFINRSTISGSITVSANSYKEDTINGTKSGWYPIGIVGFNQSGTGTSWTNLVKNYISSASNGSVTAIFGFRNYSSSSVTITVDAHILWVKVG